MVITRTHLLYSIMKNSKFLGKKVLIPAVIVAVAVGLTIWGRGLSPQTATVNQVVNAAVADGGYYEQMPKITGSVSADQPLKNFIKDNPQVSFPQASEIATKQIASGIIVGGHFGIVQGYLVYTFFIVNATDNTGHMIVIDAGNGHVLYASQGQAMGPFSAQSSPMFGLFGTWEAHGPFGGFWHEQ
jgi:hypothetical protein